MLKVCGMNYCFQHGDESNNTNSDGKSIIIPPISMKIDTSKLISLSSYGSHTVSVMNDGKAFGIGYNIDGRIQQSIPKTFLNQFTQITFEHQKYDAISACCGLLYTLYLLSPKGGECYNKLAYALKQIKTKFPMILSSNLRPAAIFGGLYHSAAIDADDRSSSFHHQLV